MPLLPPVTTIVLPERSGMSSAVHAFLSAIARVPPRQLRESYHTTVVSVSAKRKSSSHSHYYWVQGSPLPPTAEAMVSLLFVRNSFEPQHPRCDSFQYDFCSTRSELQCKWEWSA